MTLLIIGGCTVGPDFKPPTSLTGAHWHDKRAGDENVSETADPDPRWWNNFGDPVLSRLTAMAVGGNLNLQQALLRVVEARQNIVSARAAGLPTLNGTASYNREQIGAKGILESQGVYSDLDSFASGGSSLSKVQPGINEALNQLVQPFDLYQLELSSSWELDLFGQVRRSVEQARANTAGQAESTRASLIMLESQVAQAYVQLRGAQALTTSQKQNIRTAQSSLMLTERLERQGLGTALDTEQAETQLLSYQQQLFAYEKQAEQSIDQINVLVGPATWHVR